MKDSKKAEEIAAKRVQMLSPLLAEGLDAGQIRTLKTEICAQTGISERTLRRYLAQYRTQGFGGLKPGHQRQRPIELRCVGLFLTYSLTSPFTSYIVS
jgi:hypothetical protein